jgi:leucyl aminopeptidase
MITSVKHQSSFDSTAQLTVLLVQGDDLKGKKGTTLEQDSGFAWLKLAKAQDFEGQSGQEFHCQGERHLLILGLGESKELDSEACMALGAKVTKCAQKIKASSIQINALSNLSSGVSVQSFLTGAHLGFYKFDKYKKKDDQTKAVKVRLSLIIDNPKGLPALSQRAKVLAKAISRARDWVNEPGNKLPPKALALEAKKLAKEHGLQAKIIEGKDLIKENMNLFLSVAHGSTKNPPAFIHLSYKPKAKSSRKVFLVGKGVMFDTGGISLKPSGSMMTMKMDMGGASAVLATIAALAELKAKVEVHAIVAATENMPDGDATRPGDIVTGRNGTTVEILNTDAEGRLTLADALTYSVDKGATEIIDLATLTGACITALGEQTAALYSDHEELRQGLLDASDRGGEQLWHMPLNPSLKKKIKSPVADLKNIGGGGGGSITAALFLQEFTENVPWAHLDIAGPAFGDEERGHISKGGRGFGVGTLVEYLCPTPKD